MREILKDLPNDGTLFPYLRTVRVGDRATEFKQRCDGPGIKGVSLHSYRYAWAERAKAAGYPERYAQVTWVTTAKQWRGRIPAKRKCKCPRSANGNGNAKHLPKANRLNR
jgi:hypothetical protein